MSFNWRLLLAPERVLDYVVWHEVCHLEVADHSPRFWGLLESRLPGWREPARGCAGTAPRWCCKSPVRSVAGRPPMFVPSGRCRRKLLILAAAGAAIAAPLAGAHAAHRKPAWTSSPRGRSARDLQRHGRRRLPLPPAATGGGLVPFARHDLHRDRHLQLARHLRRGPGGGTQRRAGHAGRQRPAQRRPSSSGRAARRRVDERPAPSRCARRRRPGDGDLAYPGVDGRRSRAGSSRSARSRSSCAARTVMHRRRRAPANIVQGYGGLQASVSFPRALLSRTGDYGRRSRSASSGLYTDVPLNGSCNSTQLRHGQLRAGSPGGGGPRQQRAASARPTAGRSRSASSR